MVVDDLGPAILDAVRYLRAVQAEDVVPLFVGPPDRFRETAAAWRDVAPGLGELEVLEAGRPAGPSRERRIRVLPRDEGDFVTVVIPEVLVSHSWIRIPPPAPGVVPQERAAVRACGVVVTDVPLVPEELERSAGSHAEHPTDVVRRRPRPSLRRARRHGPEAVVYAKALRPTHVEGLYFMGDPEEGEEVVEAWHGAVWTCRS